MKGFVVLAVAAVAHGEISSAVMDAFSSFQKKFLKSYDDNEYGHRLAVFASNLELVNRQNAEHILAGGNAVFGVTKFMDLTADEFKAQYLTYIPNNATDAKRASLTLDAPLAATVDWRTKGAVTKVKDQGQCGTHFTFVVVT